MNSVAIDLRHCYGIKALTATLDFSTQRVYALYAPNGVMKSSFAQTFYDISRNLPSRDRIFKDRISTRQVRDEAGAEIAGDSIFVVRPYDQEFAHSEKTSILLVDTALRKEYEELQSRTEKQKEILLKALKQHSKSKKDLEAEVSSAFTSSDQEFETALTRIQTELTEMQDAVFADVPYDTIFDDKVLAFLRTAEAQAVIEVYVKRYNELLGASTYFKKGTFDYYNAGQIAESLASNGFFAAKHTVTLNAEKKLEIADPAFVAAITSSQTQVLLEEFRSRFTGEIESLAVLDRVMTMTPENIHLNSFMYEPIVDMSDEHLRKLYTDVLALK